MNFSGIGDLAQNLMLRRQGASLKGQMTRLTQELTTGQSKDTSGRTRGDFGALAGIERHLSRLSAFQQVRDGFNGQITGIQTVLGAIQSSVDGYGAELIAAATLEQTDVLAAKSANARGHLEQVVSYLNTQHSGRFLFSGVATDQKPLTSAETIMNELQTVASAASDATDLLAQFDSWFFDSGGGFETLVYGGSSETASGIRISEAASVDQPVSAENEAFRSLMRGLALTVLVSEGLAPVSADEIPVLIVSAGQSVIDGQYAVTSLQREVGDVEAKLEREDVAARSERVVTEEAKGRITAVDPYEAAAELEAVQFQIETLYVLTARLSQLRLTDYLR